MNSTPKKILMIDDHPSQIEGYKTILSYNRHGLEIEATACHDCETAYNLIHSPAAAKYDLVFLDQNLPAFESRRIMSGSDLAPLIRKKMPRAMLVFLTSHIEAFVLYNIIQKLQPEGLLVKSDFDAEDLLRAFDCILQGGTYHSETVMLRMKTMLSRTDYLDSLNRQIIHCLSKGVKTKHLPDHVHLSLSAIEKRKAQIKDYFCIGAGKDKDIVTVARDLGFV